MNTSFFALVFRQRYIKRWGLMRNVNDENLSEHSAQVAMIAHALAYIGNKHFGKSYDTGAIVTAALYHDAPEVYTGDMPTPVKYFTDQMRQNYRVIEENAIDVLLSHLPEDFRDEYQKILAYPEEYEIIIKSADKLCAYIKCIEELKCSNSEFEKAKQSTYTSLLEMNCPELNYFMEKFLPAFELTLDEMQS